MSKSNIVVFRVDSSLDIGTGHVMRCLTLAAELQHRGAQIFFICREFPGNLGERIKAKGHRLFVLPINRDTEIDNLTGANAFVNYASWLGESWQTDSQQTISVIEQEQPGMKVDWLIVDHYAIDAKWEQKLAKSIDTRVMVIDDLANRPHFCDILLDQNFFNNPSERYVGLINNACTLLLGPKYALLRPAFRENQSAETSGRNGVLIYLGSGDLAGLMIDVLTQFDRYAPQHLLAHLVVSKSMKNFDQIIEVAKTLGKERCQVHLNEVNMACLMKKCVAAVGAPGSSTWERCAKKLPMLLIATANNQEAVGQSIANHGAAIYLGRMELVDAVKLGAAMNLILTNTHLATSLSNRGWNLCDGWGTKRVAKQLMIVSIRFRPADIEDMELIYQLRNSDQARMVSNDSSKIDIEQHRKWYFQSLNNPNRILLVVLNGDNAIGSLRFDISEHKARISLNLASEQIGKGLGSTVIKQASDWLFVNYAQVKFIEGEILSNNPRSIAAFAAAGYQHEKEIYVLMNKLIEDVQNDC